MKWFSRNDIYQICGAYNLRPVNIERRLIRASALFQNPIVPPSELFFKGLPDLVDISNPNDYLTDLYIGNVNVKYLAYQQITTCEVNVYANTLRTGNDIGGQWDVDDNLPYWSFQKRGTATPQVVNVDTVMDPGLTPMIFSTLRVAQENDQAEPGLLVVNVTFNGYYLSFK